MSDRQGIDLHVTRDSIDDFCRQVVQSSANTGRQHATLIALEGFIAGHAGSDSHSPAYNEILRIIGNYSAQTRSKLLAEQMADLLSALRNRQTREISRIYRTLSRGGFWEIMGQALERLEPAERQACREWAADWCTGAEKAAQEASGYPDAMNFRAANIDLGEYRAMNDLHKLTQSLS
jgi:hypothetical protein